MRSSLTDHYMTVTHRITMLVAFTLEKKLSIFAINCDTRIGLTSASVVVFAVYVYNNLF